MTGSVPGLSHPVSLTTHPAFPAHALVSALRNLPLDSDQESQEARLPERGTELPVAHWHPQRWDPGLRTGAWEESRARSWGLLGSSRLLVPGGGRLSATDVSSRHRNPVGVWARDFPTQTLSGAWEREGKAEPAGFGLGGEGDRAVRGGALSP